MNRFRLPALGAALLCGVVACESSDRPAPLGRRLISLTPSVTRILDAIGARDDLVGVDSFSRRIPGLESIPSVGGFFSPDLERIVSLQPTLVLAVRTAQQRPLLEQLRARGIGVGEIEPYTLEEVMQSFLELGRLVGREARARDLVADVRSELHAVRQSVARGRRPTAAFVVERDPLYVAGGGGFVHELIETAGGRNVFGNLPAPYPRVSLEALADRAPDVILDSAVDPESAEAGRAEAIRFWGRFAWSGRIEAIPRGLLTLPGPELGEAARLLRARLHDAPAGSDP